MCLLRGFCKKYSAKMSDSGSESEVEVPRISRKRQKHVEEWKTVARKRKRDSGEAYVSQQNLLVDDSNEPIKHPLINEIFSGKKGSSYFKPSN